MSSTVSTGVPPRATTSLPSLIERENRRRRRTLVLRWLAVAAIPILIVLAWALFRPKPIPFADRFRTGSVTRGDLTREVRATGHLEAESTVEVGAEISGRLSEVLVDFNDHVRKGQVLARFDRAALSAQLAQTEAGIAAAAASLDQARADALKARQDLVRAEELFAKQIISPSEHDAARSGASAAEARVRAAESQLAAQKAAKTLAQTNLDHSVVRAPVDGIVITRKADPGQTIVSALQTPVLFVVAADLRRMEVVAAVDEADVGAVTEGQRAEFSVNAWPDRTFEGTVTEVRNAPEVVQDVVTYGTVISVKNEDLALKPGMTASVRVRTSTVSDALRVPAGALRFTPPGEKETDEHVVWVVDGDTIRRVPVRVGISDGESTAVEGDLPEGARVAIDLSPAGKKVYGVSRI